MKRYRWIPMSMVLAVVLVTGATPATAGEPGPGPGKPFADDDSLYDAPGRTVFAPRRSAGLAFRGKVAKAEAEARARVAALTEKLAKATPAEAPELARQVDAAKREHDIRLLEIRLQRARGLGLDRPALALEKLLLEARAGRKGGR